MMTSLFFGTSWPRKIPYFKKLLPPLGENSFLSAELKINTSKYYLLCIYAVVQLLLPLRHWLYPGNVNWTEEGHYFSWRMMLRGKSGSITYKITLPGTDSTFTENPLPHINQSQYNDLIGKPELIIQYAHFLTKKYQYLDAYPIKVYAITNVSLNGRPTQPIVDSTVDLAAEKRSLKHYDWIIPLQIDHKDK